MSGLLQGLEGAGVVADLAHHGHQTVAARGREVLAQANAVDEVEVGVEDLVGRPVVEHPHQQGHNALDDKRVGIGAEIDAALGVELRVDPDAALAALDQVGRGLFRLRSMM